jgi:hypothetical protein
MTQVHVGLPIPDPEQNEGELYPAKVDPVLAVAVSWTLVPLAKSMLHVAGQLMPRGELTTAPVPVPDRVTVIFSGFKRSNWMLTLTLPLTQPHVGLALPPLPQVVDP